MCEEKAGMIVWVIVRMNEYCFWCEWIGKQIVEALRLAEVKYYDTRSPYDVAEQTITFLTTYSILPRALAEWYPNSITTEWDIVLLSICHGGLYIVLLYPRSGWNSEWTYYDSSDVVAMSIVYWVSKSIGCSMRYSLAYIPLRVTHLWYIVWKQACLCVAGAGNGLN